MSNLEKLRRTYQKLRRRFPIIYNVDRRIRRSEDRLAITEFLSSDIGLSRLQRKYLVERIKEADNQLECAHTQAEILTVINHLIRLRDGRGVMVEAGCYKGGSAAKLSAAAKLLNQNLVLFDSFVGIPTNSEVHGANIYGDAAGFSEGDYAGSQAEVREAIRQYGDLSVCSFVKGFFDDTMPLFETPVSVAYIDVDLASSTKSCLKYIYPLLVPGGVIISQDGHLPLVINVLEDKEFWSKEVGVEVPQIDGLWEEKLIVIHKPL